METLKEKIAAIIAEACMHEVRAIDYAEHHHQCEKPIHPIDPFEYADKILIEMNEFMKQYRIEVENQKNI